MVEVGAGEGGEEGTQERQRRESRLAVKQGPGALGVIQAGTAGAGDEIAHLGRYIWKKVSGLMPK